MSKYIPADKLIAEIERYENTAIDAYNPHGEDADFWYGKVVACEDLKTLITSLQQEQPPLPSNLDEAARDYALSPEDVAKIFNKVRELQVKYPATEACFEEVAEWFNNLKEEKK